MIKIECIDGRNVKMDDCFGGYCSQDMESKGIYEIDIIGEEALLTFFVDESDIIQFTSKRSFGVLAKKDFKYKKIVENGSIQLGWNLWHFILNGLKELPSWNKYDYMICTLEGTIYLSKSALAALISAIEETHKQLIYEKKEFYFNKAVSTLAFLETPWKEHSETYQKIQSFAKMQALSIFIDASALAAFESDFSCRWNQNSTGECDLWLVFQTNLMQNNPNRYFIKNPLAKFDTLVRLVASSCHWEESYAAVRTYGALLASVKNESKNQCNITYNFKIEPDWPYEDCLKNYITCVKELYKDPVCFGCFVYYLMLEQKIPLPPKSERIPEHLGFQYAYKKVKEDIAPLAKDFFDNLEVLQLEKELASDSSRSTMAVEDYDLMSGQEFEQAIAKIFKNMGYQVTMTPTTGDQGIDIIAVRNGIRIGIQAKCYTGKVGNSAVQEVVAGKQYYNLNRCMVVTNSVFTSAAVALAKANNVTLWDRYVLEEKLLSLSCEESD